MEFNYFKILSKDDKELIHSSFIRFLLQDDVTSDFIMTKLFPAFETEIDKPSILLEKVYSYKVLNEKREVKSKRVRIDIEGGSVDRNTLLVVENKFKSFPYIEQLEIYDDRFSEEHGDKRTVKYLLCFDKDIIPFVKENWYFLSYKELLSVLNLLLKNVELENEKRLFIEHYIRFLSQYYVQYELIKDSCGHLFFDGRNDEYKFWIRHINAIARLKLQDYFDNKNIAVRFDVNPGSTNVPLINIMPKHWNRENEVETLVQVQGDGIKYYYHSNDLTELNKLITAAQIGIQNPTGKFNKLNPKRGKTNFIYHEKWNKSIKDRAFSVDDFVSGIIEFYEKIDEVAKERFKN